MKETEGFSIRLFAEKCKGKQGRARLAAAVGLLAMLLILRVLPFNMPLARQMRRRFLTAVLSISKSSVISPSPQR